MGFLMRPLVALPFVLVLLLLILGWYWSREPDLMMLKSPSTEYATEQGVKPRDWLCNYSNDGAGSRYSSE